MKVLLRSSRQRKKCSSPGILPAQPDQNSHRPANLLTACMLTITLHGAPYIEC
jgi:hypothetical protein